MTNAFLNNAKCLLPTMLEWGRWCCYEKSLKKWFFFVKTWEKLKNFSRSKESQGPRSKFHFCFGVEKNNNRQRGKKKMRKSVSKKE